MERRPGEGVAFSHMATLAALSAVALLGVALWKLDVMYSSHGATATSNPAQVAQKAATPLSSINWQIANPDASTTPGDTDGISNIGPNVVSALFGSYAAMQQTGTYSPEKAQQAATAIGESLKASISYSTYTRADIHTDTDTSYKRMLQYRSDLQAALAPLLKNPGYELKLFSAYIDTKDKAYLTELRAASANYKSAVANMQRIVVPADAVDQHVAAMNSLSAFGELVDNLVTYADDPFATAALLRTYTDAEASLVTTFNAVATYEKSKTS